MAVPTYIFHDNFESGDASGWNVAESDTDGQLDFPHYSTLARIPGIAMPYCGAYCARWQLAFPINTDSTIGDDSITIADGETIWVRFRMWISPDVAASIVGVDNITVLEFQRTTGNGVIYNFGIRFSGTAHWIVGATTLAGATSTGTIELGKWNTIELKVNVQTGAATGEIELYVTPEGGEPSETVTVSLGSNQSTDPVVRAVLGIQDKNTTTVGTILIDDFAVDNVRIYPGLHRFSRVRQLTGSSHVFVGPGTVERVVMQSSAATDNVVTIYDTDTGQTHQGIKKVVLANTATSEVVEATMVPFHVDRGCFVEIAGTANPEVFVTIGNASAGFSEGGMRNYAQRL